jgi:CO/xanthine dehydrogenase Mo-binding subunit
MSDNPPLLLPFDRPNSYIGRAVPRPNAARLTRGRGRFVDDIALPRMLHAAFVRSPHAHAAITAIDLTEARALAGVARVAEGAEIAEICKPWTGTLSHLQGLRSPPQNALATDVVRWLGEPVAVVVAASREIAEDAAGLVWVDYDPLPAVTDAETALDANATVIHAELGDNLAWRREIVAGDPDAAFARADHVVEEVFHIDRHTGVTPETRTLIADFDRDERKLTVYHGGQSPHMMQSILAERFGLEEVDIRVVAGDVGGSFGLKIHTYGDEIAAVALSVMLGRPVKFIADRLESFVTDIHARDHRVRARIALSGDGEIQAFEIDDLTGIGPYSMYPRTSAVEANQILNLVGSQYLCPNYRATADVVFQNKNMMSQYRAVGHPVACTVTEGLVDKAAREIGIDPMELRRRNLVPDDGYPHVSPSGMRFEILSHHASLEKLASMLNYDGLRAEQARLRGDGIHRGIGLATFVEVTNPSPMFYGAGGARIAAQDGCVIKLEPSGVITCATGVTEQGQGTEAVIAQVAATAFGVSPDRVRVITGDTDKIPYGGGTWGSRGAGIGGEAAYQAARALRGQVLETAAVMLQSDPDTLDIAEGWVVDRDGGTQRLGLDDLARTVYFRGNELPHDHQPELLATRHFRVKDYPFVFTNGVQASWLEVDAETGFVTLLDHWVVEDCGRIINPLLVDEQVRGGVVQGLGGALFEHCVYDATGQLLNATLADYLVPMSGEMPDIKIGHVETPTATSELGAKGAGEAGTAGAAAAVMNAINDALAPLGARVTAQPFTPERILKAIGKTAM